MNTNVVCLNTFQSTNIIAPAFAANDNVVSLDAWRARSRPRCTAAGVFFVTEAFVTPGDAA